ncbi:hypothetical protein Vretifemale_16148 [Volvox reticuliferus]|uniref:Peptidase C45 hydrolase domain-containing protein n=1 Tax=Volvox reticuliferus TaxID=1737510 RepID=A0A8J4CUX8_9CHLO|nr:hypothetical protein Vretifemale_16148 [Volvox reticuliferus]
MTWGISISSSSAGNHLSIIFLCLLLQNSRACYKRLVYHGAIPLLYIDDCTSNYELGLLVGATFSSTIKGRMRDSLAFQKVQAYCSTNWGRQLLAALKDCHRIAFPAYFSELQGLAAGSGVPFDQVFMLNLRQEILAAGESPDVLAGFQQWLGIRSTGGTSSAERDIDGSNGGRDGDVGRAEGDGRGNGRSLSSIGCATGGCHGSADGGGDVAVESNRSQPGDGDNNAHVDPSSVDACSDVAVRLRSPDGPPGSARLILGHNEDMTNDTLGRMYYIRATMPGRGSWFALTYAGELASTAFGANTAGVGFTLNALYPSDALLPGLGRNFLSRRLLDAGSVEEALEVLVERDQATGRSVNLMSTRPPLGVWNVEVGPGGAHDVLELQDNTWYYHANAYMRLPQRQKLDNSSVHREARFAQFTMPAGPADVLEMLGDTSDAKFPVYRTGDYGGLVYTLCTVLYDLSGSRMMVYRGNPRDGVLGSVLDLYTLMPVGPHGGEQKEGDLAKAVMAEQDELDEPWV